MLTPMKNLLMISILSIPAYTNAYATQKYKEADEQFTIAIKKLKEVGQEHSEELANDAANAHQKAQNSIQSTASQTTKNDQVAPLTTAMDHITLGQAASSPTTTQPQQEDFSYNSVIEDLQNNKNWNVIIEIAAELEASFKQEILTLSATTPINQQKTIFAKLSREAFASIGEAYLNKDVMKGIKFFSYCKGLYPSMDNFSPDILQEISKWLNTYHTFIFTQSEIKAASNFMEQQNYRAAGIKFKEAIEKLKNAQVGINSSLFKMAGFAKYKAGELAEALDFYKEGLAASPTPSASSYIEATEPAMDLNEWRLAANWFKIALTIDGNQDASVYSNAGLAFLTIKDYAQALVYLNKALELNPSLPKRVYERRDMAKKALGQ